MIQRKLMTKFVKKKTVLLMALLACMKPIDEIGKTQLARIFYE